MVQQPEESRAAIARTAIRRSSPGAHLTGLPPDSSAGRPAEDTRSSAESGGERPATWTWEEPVLPPCPPGQQLFDSRHGVVVVESVERRMLQGRLAAYVALRTVQGDLRILLPLASAPTGSLRRLINAQEVRSIFAELSAESQPTPAWTAQSFGQLQIKLFGRNPLVVAAIVRDLRAKADGGRLHFNEKALLARGTELLVAELSTALQITRRDAALRMEGALESGRTVAGGKPDTGTAVVVSSDGSQTA